MENLKLALVWIVILILACGGVFVLGQLANKEDCSRWEMIATKGMCGITAP